MQELSSTRTTIHELAADELERTLPIYMSNPEFVQQQEGSESEPGRYDLARWQRDWSIAQYMPGRHLLVAYLKDEQRTPIGLVDYLEQNDDDYPYLGALIIHKDYQRQGFAREIFQTLVVFFDTTYYWPLLRAATTSGASFLHRLGFQPVEQTSEERQNVEGRQQVQLFEYVIAH
jgi:RimJ/RimL family protein N-acetyltransferase